MALARVFLKSLLLIVISTLQRLQAASFGHNLSYAQPIDFKFIDQIDSILNLLTVGKNSKFYLGGASEDLSHEVFIH